MNRNVKQNGFSLTEVLIAAAILAVGLMMIAMTFPVGVKLTSIATERTVGTVAANEAFAMFRLYSQDPDGAGLAFSGIDCNQIPDSNLISLRKIVLNPNLMPNTSFLKKLNSDDLLNYPSIPGEVGKYHWSLLARKTDANELQLTVFVSRRMDTGATYYYVDDVNDINNTYGSTSVWPQPVRVSVHYPAFGQTITVNDNTQYDTAGQTLTACRFFTEGCTIVEDRTGYLYRVIEKRDLSPIDGVQETLVLDTLFPNKGVAGTGFFLTGDVDVWVVPPAVGSSRNPCIFVQQRKVSF